MVEAVQHMLFNDIAQHFHIVHIAGFRIYLTSKPNDQVVVVAVIIVVVAFSVDTLVFFIRPVRIIQAVRGVEVFLTEHRNPGRFWHTVKFRVLGLKCRYKGCVQHIQARRAQIRWLFGMSMQGYNSTLWFIVHADSVVADGAS